MKVIDYIVIHSLRENTDRTTILEWCNQTFEEYTWWMNSDYREEGCFKLSFSSIKDAEFYILKWSGMVLETVYKTEQVLKVDEDLWTANFG